MAFFSRKNNVPEELPDLVIDEIKDKLKSEEISDKKTPSQFPKTFAPKITPLEKKSETPVVEKTEIVVRPNPIDNEKSFFNKLLTDINEEVNDLGKLEGWYNNKFVDSDIVSGMKDYWEDKKSELVIKSLGKGFKDKINTKIESLQKLEKEWQDIYLTLLEKEEELKREEKELKQVVSEFMDMCKRRGSIKDEKPIEKKD